MKVLVACEYSGIVREAFKAKGHDAWSCDILDTEIPGNHYKGDVMDIINDGWDLMVAHPPCTYLSYAAARYWNEPGREVLRMEALDFFISLYQAPIKRVCIENPHGYARIAFRQPDQEIHPYYFGDPFMKRTCLWLKNLPKLKYSLRQNLFEAATASEKPKPSFIRKDGNKQYGMAVVKSGKDRAKERARFWPSVAAAMADQWT
jgi:hypothetical protein